MENQSDLEDKQESTISNWVWVSTLLFIVILVSSVAVYKYAHFDGVDAKTLRAGYIKKTDISFNDLKYDEQKEYVTSSSVDSQKDKLEKLQKDLSYEKEQTNKISNEVTECKESLIIARNSLQKALLKVKNKTSRVLLEKRLQCDDTEVGSYHLSKSCKERVKKLVSNLDSDITIEIIPLVDKHDFAVLESLAELGNSAYMKSQSGAKMLCTMVNSMGLNINNCADSWLDSLHLSKSELERLSFIANTGLGKLRSNEADWYISTLTKNEIQPVNYHIKTDDKRGFILRLYR